MWNPWLTLKKNIKEQKESTVKGLCSVQLLLMFHGV